MGTRSNKNDKLLKLLKKYPDAKIYTFTHYEVVCEDWGYWSGKIEKAYYGKFWECDERIYFTYDELLDSAKDDDFISEPVKYEGIILQISN